MKTTKEKNFGTNTTTNLSQPVVDQKRLIEWARNFQPKKQKPFLDLRETTKPSVKSFY